MNGGLYPGRVISLDRFKQYVVQPGDSWESIAKAQLGDGRKFGELLRFNTPLAVEATTCVINPTRIFNDAIQVRIARDDDVQTIRIRCDYCGRKPEADESMCKGCGAPL